MNNHLPIQKRIQTIAALAWILFVTAIGCIGCLAVFVDIVDHRTPTPMNIVTAGACLFAVIASGTVFQTIGPLLRQQWQRLRRDLSKPGNKKAAQE